MTLVDLLRDFDWRVRRDAEALLIDEQLLPEIIESLLQTASGVFWAGEHRGAQLHAAPDAARWLLPRERYTSGPCGSAPVSSGPLGGAISVRSRMVPVLE